MAEQFPARVVDLGIAEQHAVTFSAAMAACGLKPFVAIYSTFIQRGFDQIVHDVALQGLPVRFAIDRAGLVGADGATRTGAFDVGYLSNLPGFVVMPRGMGPNWCIWWLRRQSMTAGRSRSGIRGGRGLACRCPNGG